MHETSLLEHPLHDFALGKGVVGPMTPEYINGTKDILKIFYGNKERFDIKDKNGKTPLDLALEHAPVLLTKEFIEYSLLENPKLAKPSSLPTVLSDCWDNLQTSK